MSTDYMAAHNDRVRVRRPVVYIRRFPFLLPPHPTKVQDTPVKAVQRPADARYGSQ